MFVVNYYHWLRLQFYVTTDSACNKFWFMRRHITECPNWNTNINPLFKCMYTYFTIVYLYRKLKKRESSTKFISGFFVNTKGQTMLNFLWIIQKRYRLWWKGRESVLNVILLGIYNNCHWTIIACNIKVTDDGKSTNVCHYSNYQHQLTSPHYQ